jgi:hypothetical protein
MSPVPCGCFCTPLSLFSVVCAGGEFPKWFPLPRYPLSGGPILINVQQFRPSIGCKNGPLDDKGPTGGYTKIVGQVWDLPCGINTLYYFDTFRILS